jgi:hypothetical protein
VDFNDFDSLSDSSLHHLILGGGVEWQRYDRGSLAKMKSLQKITLNVPFCENLDLFENLLEDVNETQTTDLELVNVFPDLCNVTGDPFRNLRTMPLVKNLTILNTWINSSFMMIFLKNVFLSNVVMITFANITYNEDTPEGFKFPTLNHTMVISSVIFDNVNHYQYRYPTFEMSVDIYSKLEFLKFSGTRMNIVPCNVMSSLPSLETLDLSNNLLSDTGFWWPGCSYTSVFPTLNKSLLPDWPLDYTCSTPPSVADLPMSEYRTSRMSCEAWLQAAVALPVTMLIVLALCSAFYACDGVWYTKMLWMWIRVKRRGQKQANLLNNTTFRYHSFISYSHQDSAWVESKLVPSLEGAGLSLCIHERDFVPGQWIVDNIINCVEASYKTLFVLSNHFVQSEWCNYELFFAQHRALDAQQDSLVFILLEPIPTNSLPKKFLKLRRLLMQQTYLEWPMDERKQQVFWVNLRSMLQVADHRILKDMALELTKSASLIPDDLVPLLK